MRIRIMSAKEVFAKWAKGDDPMDDDMSHEERELLRGVLALAEEWGHEPSRVFLHSRVFERAFGRAVGAVTVKRGGVMFCADAAVYDRIIGDLDLWLVHDEDDDPFIVSPTFKLPSRRVPVPVRDTAVYKYDEEVGF